MVETEDPKVTVENFYRKAENRDGWRLLSEPPMMVLERAELQLSIFIHDEDQGALIFYERRRLR